MKSNDNIVFLRKYDERERGRAVWSAGLKVLMGERRGPEKWEDELFWDTENGIQPKGLTRRWAEKATPVVITDY